MATDIPRGNGERPVERIREEVQTLLGTRGDPLDAALTLRSAIDRGLIDRIGNALVGNVTYVNTFPTTGGGSAGTTPDMTAPPTVDGLVVSAGFTSILVQFTAPAYTTRSGTASNLRTNIYAVKKDPADATLQTFAAGVTPLVSAAAGTLNIVSIPSEPNTRWHVWAKHMTVDGVESAAAAGGTNGYNAAGAYPTTGQDVAQLLAVLAGKVTASELATTLNTRINLVDAASGVAGSVNARVLAETTARAAALTALSAVKSRTFYSATAPVSDGTYTLQAGDVWYNTADSNKPYVQSGGAWVAAPDTRVGQAVIDISNETTNRSAADAAEVSARESLYAGFGGSAGADYKVFNQAGAPTGTTIGDVWTWKTGAGVETFSRWNGSAWVDSSAARRAAVYRGEYANAGALPSAGNVIGDLARQTDTNGVVVWNGSAWAAKTSLPAPVYAFVEKESRARADAVSAEASARDTLAVQLRGTNTGTDVSTLSAGLIYSERVARATAVSTQATRVDGLESSVNTAGTGLLSRASALETTTTAAGSGNAALASRSLTLEASVNNPTDANNPTRAALTTESSVRASQTGPILASYSVKLDVNGYMTGYGLTSSLVAGGTPTSMFLVSVDKFAVATPTTSVTNWTAGATIGINEIRGVAGNTDKVLVCKTPGTTGSATPAIAGALGTTLQDGGVAWQIASRVPFAVLTVPTTVNGVSLPAGVYIDAAYVLNGTIKKAQLGDAIIDDAKIIDVSASKLRTGAVEVGADITSNVFVSGSAGWRIHGNGAAEFAAASIRGLLTASQINSNGLSIKNAAGTVILNAGSALDFNSRFGDTTGLPANGATVGATIGVDLGGRITSATASTYIADAAIDIAQIKVASIGSLSALSATIGTLRTATTGARMEIADNVIRVYDSVGNLRVKLGNLA